MKGTLLSRNSFLFPLFLSFVLSCGFPTCTCAADVQNTSNKDKALVESNLNEHLFIVGRNIEGTSANFTTDGGYRPDKLNFPKGLVEFSRKVGETFYGPPDHHASIEFKVKKIEATGVSLEYKSQFDHRSFGKDLITIDTGEIKLGYFDR